MLSLGASVLVGGTMFYKLVFHSLAHSGRFYTLVNFLSVELLMAIPTDKP